MTSLPLAPRPRPRKGRSLWLIGGIAALGIGAVILDYCLTLRLPEAVAGTASPSFDSKEPIQPIQASFNLDSRKVELGRRLFHDPRLSHDNTVSCASCHDLKTGGTDRRPRSLGVDGAVGVINAPTVLNSALNFSQFWDGRAPTLEAQIDEPIQSKIEMGSSWSEVTDKLRRLEGYRQAFRAIYRDEVQPGHVRDAIAEFERSLATPRCRFDRFLGGDGGALSNRELAGYKLFKLLGCASCHQGMNIGGNMFQRLGVMAPYFADRGHMTRADQGRFNVTGDPRDRYMFKVPSLRNVKLTAPYFHDGNAATLPDAVRMMAKYQLGRRLDDEEAALLVEFLESLTGELNGIPL